MSAIRFRFMILTLTVTVVTTLSMSSRAFAEAGSIFDVNGQYYGNCRAESGNIRTMKIFFSPERVSLEFNQEGGFKGVLNVFKGFKAKTLHGGYYHQSISYTATQIAGRMWETDTKGETFLVSTMNITPLSHDVVAVKFVYAGMKFFNCRFRR